MFPQRSHRSVRLAAIAALVALPILAACASRSGLMQMPPEQLHAEGQQHFDDGDYAEAARVLDILLLQSPEYPQAAEARFLLARSYFLDERYLLAADEFSRFTQRHPGHPSVPEAAIGVCRAQSQMSPIPARDQTYTMGAVRVCQDVIIQYRGHAVAEEARAIVDDMLDKLAEKEYKTGEQYFRRGGYDPAIIYWGFTVDNYPNTQWAPRALLGICRAWERIGYEDDAEEARLRLLNLYPDSEAAREVSEDGGDCS